LQGCRHRSTAMSGHSDPPFEQCLSPLEAGSHSSRFAGSGARHGPNYEATWVPHPPWSGSRLPPIQTPPAKRGMPTCSELVHCRAAH
jgi:hypothetical protein